jgi:hypothetical protein
MKVAKEEDGIVADWQGLAVWEAKSRQERGCAVCVDNVLLFSRRQAPGFNDRASRQRG